MKYERNTTLQALISEMPQIMVDEGFVRSIYRDTLGYLTFGFGTLITDEMPEHGQPEGTPVSDERCIEEFFGELCYQTLADGPAVFGHRAWDTFPAEAKQVFLNMAYNMGRSRLSEFKRMIAAAKDHDWATAATEAKDSRWYGQVKSRAVRLVTRLEALA
ncbi:MAG: hypothetical protein AAF404_08995 [Pseudomonadota bacterium]